MKILGQWASVFVAVAVFATSARAAELASVNERKITDVEMKAALAQFSEGQRANIMKDPASRRQILMGMIDQEILFQQSEKEKLDQDEEFKRAQDGFRRQYMVSKLLQKSVGSKLTEKAAKGFYSAHKTEFATDQVRAQHILVSNPTEAAEILKKVKAPGADFQKIAEQVSKDPTAKNNRGDLGYFGREQMVSEFSNAAFSGSEGEIVGPVKTAYGYHVIKVIDKKVGSPLSYDEVELKVKERVRQQLVQDYVGSIRGKAKVTLNEAAIDKL